MTDPEHSDQSNSGADDVTINVAFWNLQNFFDTEVSSIAADLECTPVNGWERRAFEAKILNLAEVIRMMFNGAGPDLLGLCEIENERIARILIKAIGRDDYALAHVEHPDICGLDTSLIYSTRLFELNKEKTRGHVVHLRYPTRDIFEAHLKVRENGSDLVVLVNHWPSRKPGAAQSEPFRMTVASHCARRLEDNVKVGRREYLSLDDNELSLRYLNQAWDRNVLVMGDFNDEPWDRSVREVLRAGFSQDHIAEPIRFIRGSLPSYKSYASRSAWLFNPMWSLMNKPDQGSQYDSGGTHTMNLIDQFMLSRGLYFGNSGLTVRRNAAGLPEVEIFRPDIMCTRKGRPREFNCENRTGYSDHFPITTSLTLTPCD